MEIQNYVRGLAYSDLNIGMKVRFIRYSSPRYLQEGMILSIEDDFCGGYDLRLRMETGEVIGGIDPAELDYE